VRQREGYLLIDHQASPGIPEDMAVAFGMNPQLVKEGKVLEAATLTCVHCKGSAVKNPWRARERGSCMKCGGKYICDACALETRLPNYDHTPFEKKVDVLKDLEAKGFFGGTPQTLTQSKLILP
jgi:hypothetical protein